MKNPLCLERDVLEARERREKIENILRNGQSVTGSTLAKLMGVSRQVIVTDIAIMRAAGLNIYATPQGYLIPVEQQQAVQGKIACSHDGLERLEKELCIIVDNGAKVVDVIVEHPVYGEIKGNLMIASRLDIKMFLEKLKTSNARPLSVVTGGIHLHTIEAPSGRIIEKVMSELNTAGILVN